MASNTHLHSTTHANHVSTRCACGLHDGRKFTEAGAAGIAARQLRRGGQAFQHGGARRWGSCNASTAVLDSSTLASACADSRFAHKRRHLDLKRRWSWQVPAQQQAALDSIQQPCFGIIGPSWPPVACRRLSSSNRAAEARCSGRTICWARRPPWEPSGEPARETAGTQLARVAPQPSPPPVKVQACCPRIYHLYPLLGYAGLLRMARS